ncbi:MAG TPA: DsbA family protein [Rhodospirillales bacterium]|nr:DsbA family protein [Rhodospirillales bacterium]
MTNKIIYIGDPMCSWCWGFASVIDSIHKDFNHEAPLSIILGGLHAYDDFPMSNNYKTNIRHHWEDVNRATGAVFDYRFFDRDGFILDTEPACRAVVTIRKMKPNVVLSFYESVSRSFYSENKNTTVSNTFKPLAEQVGIDFKEFDQIFNSSQIKDETKSDFQFSKKIGVTGFPTVLVKEGEKLALLTAGYQPYQTLKPAIEDWLKNGLSEHPGD